VQLYILKVVLFELSLLDYYCNTRHGRHLVHGRTRSCRVKLILYVRESHVLQRSDPVTVVLGSYASQDPRGESVCELVSPVLLVVHVFHGNTLAEYSKAGNP